LVDGIKPGEKAMSGLLDALSAAGAINPRAAVYTMADWLDSVADQSYSTRTRQQLRNVTALLREESTPPKPTPEDVIRKALRDYDYQNLIPGLPKAITVALQDAGLLNEEKS
jgi:hypothetical protein